jgi:energy-coupling factor transporter ATP-binding protein EcfA2
MPIAPISLREIAATDYSLSDFSYVDGFFGPGQFTYLTGHPGSGKSFLIYELALCLVSGRDFVGSKVNRRANVLLIDGEMGVARCGRRLKRMMRGGVEAYNGDFYLDTQGKFRLDDLRERTDLIAWMIEHETDVLLIDSLTRVVSHELEESDSKDMALVGQYFMEIKERTDCSIMVIHHSSKSSSPLRGSSELLAQADNTFMIEERSNVRVVSPVKTRDIDMESAFRAAFTVKTGKNDGITLESAVIPQKTAAYGNRLRESVGNYIRSKPGCSARHIMADVKCGPKYCYAVLGELEAEGEIIQTKTGRTIGYYPAEM